VHPKISPRNIHTLIAQRKRAAKHRRSPIRLV
jgi:hypothetical protein